jgi:hypothetical protein
MVLTVQSFVQQLLAYGLNKIQNHLLFEGQMRFCIILTDRRSGGDVGWMFLDRVRFKEESFTRGKLRMPCKDVGWPGYLIYK